MPSKLYIYLGRSVICFDMTCVLDNQLVPDAHEQMARFLHINGSKVAKCNLMQLNGIPLTAKWL